MVAWLVGMQGVHATRAAKRQLPLLLLRLSSSAPTSINGYTTSYFLRDSYGSSRNMSWGMLVLGGILQ